MIDLTLVIGDKNFSSWSLRPWLALKMAAVDFNEIQIRLRQPNTGIEIAKYSPSGKVPVLIHNGSHIWESLAICEYVAELFPDAHLWPENRQARAIARSLAAEMHASFIKLRKYMPMDIAGCRPHIELIPEVVADILRITTIWTECRSQYSTDGPFLFGNFTIVDAMYAPVAIRFCGYSISLVEKAKSYVETLLNLPQLQMWITAAIDESNSATKNIKAITNFL